MKNRLLRLGIDIGSTSIKMILIDEKGEVLYHQYKRHYASIIPVLLSLLQEASAFCKDAQLKLMFTGSIGMGIADRLGFAFHQEVISSIRFVQEKYPNVKTFIDIGGEDAKMIFFTPNQQPDIRMNGSCAGGTGAFIDQMASLLAIPIEEMDSYAKKAELIYPIASRCGVFSKTDVQNLVARNVSKNDIAGSIFHAVALQVISSLSRGYEVRPSLFFCGAPFAFLPTLQNAFLELLQISEKDVVKTEYPELVPAFGTALSIPEEMPSLTMHELLRRTLHLQNEKLIPEDSELLPKLFESDKQREEWFSQKSFVEIKEIDLADSQSKECFLGVDSGSTTTKIVIINQKKDIIFKYYAKNGGDPLGTFKQGLLQFQEKAKSSGKNFVITSSAITGYGESLLKIAYHLHHGIVETMAHFKAAKQLSPEVSFILDIGGQDMKAIFVENNAICRIEINEACSSGCGSFIEGFADMLGMPVADFAQMACKSEAPSDLGTRCTVFMNSKVKQTLREGAPIEDLAAGLSYSVIKNCFFKVLKIKNIEELGAHIVLQGGTFKNPSMVRCVELLTKKQVRTSNIPELMGAYGAALYALQQFEKEGLDYELTIEELLQVETFESTNIWCKGCENRCNIRKFVFSNQNSYYSGNKCERVFSNMETKEDKGANFHEIKYDRLFNRETTLPHPKFIMGIPRGLVLYEDYPFWHTLLTECNIQPLLSGATTVAQYEKGAKTIMADNICFPAKLMHGHLMYLIKKNVDRILYPYNVYERKKDKKAVNSYNCPIVTAYSDVLRSAVEPEEQYGIPLDAPVLNFNDKGLLKRSLITYLSSFGIKKGEIKKAIDKALTVQLDFEKSLCETSQELYKQAIQDGRPVIVLVGRPYHIDPLIQHKISDAIARFGVTVLNEDIIREWDKSAFENTDSVTQWAFPNRIMNAANWVAEQGKNVHLVQLTSFGCGPDAFINEEIKQILQAKGKNLTLLKVDDVNNIGSLKLRVRSLLESSKVVQQILPKPVVHTPPFELKDRHRKVLAPYFAEGYSELLPPLFKVMGIELENLPRSNVTSNEFGLLFANNEICYPATLVVGDIMKALLSGKYKPEEVAVAITQTGGQCRATNYISIIKKAMIAGGFGDIPVVSVSFGSGVINEQPGFNLTWSKSIMIAYNALLYVDALSKLYYPAAVREKEKNSASQLRIKYLEAAKPLIENKNTKGLLTLLDHAIDDFMHIIDPTKKVPAIGVVGEIYVKYNSFSHKNVVDWLVDQGIEVVAPSMYNFMMAEFVNNQIKKKKNISRLRMPLFISDMVFQFSKKYSRKFDELCARYPYYRPFSDLEKDAGNASKIINLAAQFGEGWLIPAEIAGFAEQGINNAISLQPFGCIANHVISKGIEKRIKKNYPKMNLLFLDFDGGTSEANVLNRLHFMIDSVRKEEIQ